MKSLPARNTSVKRTPTKPTSHRRTPTKRKASVVEAPPAATAPTITDEQIDRWREMRLNAQNELARPGAEPPWSIDDDGDLRWSTIRRRIARLREHINEQLDRIAAGMANPTKEQGDGSVLGMVYGAEAMMKLVGEGTFMGNNLRGIFCDVAEAGEAIRLRGSVSRAEAARIHGARAEREYMDRLLAEADRRGDK